LVGNTMIDTLLANVERARARATLSDLGLAPREYGLVTMHRPANVDDDGVLAGLVKALGEVAEELPLVFPVHPRARRQLHDAAGLGRVRLVDPAGYLDFVALEASARLVLTDSGGVQEETTVLGVPCLTLRDTTERPATVTEGTNTIVGRDPARIVEEARRVLRNPPPPRRPALWDGRAGERTADVLVAACRAKARPRPTDKGSG
jgi:UDP-N-acetylglucosamine 2-epimerase (non-hydrolysing)